MVRKVSILALAVATFAAAGGCRHRCGGGWFTSGSRQTEAPCHLAGSGDGGYIGVPVGGGGYPASPPTGVFPGGAYPYPGGGGGASELPLPQPSDLIPRPGVPFAPPTVAPPEGGANLLPPPKGGVPVGR